ncbi:hypothetical protein [Amycolatopsis taiwanensis]|uniref:Uncharacterized protein n=1 Tax=Amycolatopsis taiwanensis TaxID=342230 RepID=A0A9W6R2B0_9PSEU|nr:hypothetical protein [Amycolatopsis taiwanensis]GLY66235.1 hypothetical protein Atai01_28540 [Amycolatopsis taiwanensis]
MSDPVSVDLGDSWKPASLREAEARLNESLIKSAELIKQVDEKLKQLPDVDHTAKPEDVSAIKAAAEKPDAPAALRALKKKVDAGELTWQDVLEGRALKDETVREVMTARLDGDMREIYREAEQGATLDEILEARGVTSGSVFGGGSSQSYPQTTPSAAPSEDDYFSNGFMDSKQPPATPPPAEQAPPTPPAAGSEPPRTPPPRRREVEYTDDEFENPLASRGEAKRTGPSRPAPSRRPRDEPEDDDDYFGGSVFR